MVSGLVTLPGSLAMALISPVAGKIYVWLGMKELAVAGSSPLFIGALGMCFVTLKRPFSCGVAERHPKCRHRMLRIF